MKNQSLNEIFNNVLGLYLPGDLAVSLNYPAEYWDNFDNTNPPKEFYTTMVHEFHHYNIFSGTSWGNYFTSLKREWANQGIKGYKLAKAFCLENKIELKFPILNWLPTQSQTIQKQLSNYFEIFSFYSKLMYFDLGFKQSIQLKSRIDNAYIPVGDKKIFYGAHSIIENAARLEDRLRLNDLDFKKIPYNDTYDLHWLYLKSQGFSPYVSLILLEMSLNPCIPIFKSVNALEYPPTQELVPSIRLATIITYVYQELLDNNLLNLQLGTQPKREDFDKLYTTIEKIINSKTGWKSSIEALEDLVYQIDSTGYENQWLFYPISKEQLLYVINMRKKHPSIFAIQTIGEIWNVQFKQHPPYLIMFEDRGVSTIKDPNKGAVENNERIKLAVAEQLICQNTIGGFKCPYCRITMTSNKHSEECNGHVHLEDIGINLEKTKFVYGKN